MNGMSEGDAKVLCERLEMAFPDAVAQVRPARTSGLFLVEMYHRATVDRLASFYDLPFGNRVIGMTPEPQTKEAR